MKATNFTSPLSVTTEYSFWGSATAQITARALPELLWFLLLLLLFVVCVYHLDGDEGGCALSRVASAGLLEARGGAEFQSAQGGPANIPRVFGGQAKSGNPQ